MKSEIMDAYQKAGLKRTPFFEEIMRSSFTPGFFTKLYDIGQIRRQIKAPIVMPVLCLTAALTEVIDLIENTALALINLLVLDFRRTGFYLKNMGEDIFDIGFLVCKGVYDALWETAALLSRIVASLVFLVVAGAEIIQEYFSPVAKESPERDQFIGDRAGLSDSNPFSQMEY